VPPSHNTNKGKHTAYPPTRAKPRYSKPRAAGYHLRHRKPSPLQPFKNLIAQDISVQSYIADLSTQQKPVNDGRKDDIYLALYHTLRYLGNEVTDHAVTDLIAFKHGNKDDTSIEKKLRIFKTLKNANQSRVAVTLGVFRRNFAPLDMHIHVTSNGSKTLPISEPKLLAIYNDKDLDDRHRLAMDIMAQIGERYTAGNTTPLKDFHLVEDTHSAVVDMPANVTKMGIAHPSIITQTLYERIMEHAASRGYTTPLPNYKSLWARITKVGIKNHNTRLTSHYFRKRFQSIGKTIPADLMPVNNWTMLMGEQPKVGHMPSIYDLISIHELIEQYERYFAPRITIGAENTAPLSEANRLAKENAELKEQILKLTTLLTDKLSTPRT
jgi:hypothetical protein